MSCRRSVADRRRWRQRTRNTAPSAGSAEGPCRSARTRGSDQPARGSVQSRQTEAPLLSENPQWFASKVTAYWVTRNACQMQERNSCLRDLRRHGYYPRWCERATVPVSGGFRAPPSHHRNAKERACTPKRNLERAEDPRQRPRAAICQKRKNESPPDSASSRSNVGNPKEVLCTPSVKATSPLRPYFVPTRPRVVGAAEVALQG